MTPPVWSERNLWIREFIPANNSVIDWGCGDKDILRYISPPDYLGIDKFDLADIRADFNLQIPNIEEKYDIGLVLGVLEYLDNPNSFLRSIKPTADRFLILCFVNHRLKSEWTNAFTSDEVKLMLTSLWKNVSFETYKNYLLGICTD